MQKLINYGLLQAAKNVFFVVRLKRVRLILKIVPSTGTFLNWFAEKGQHFSPGPLELI